MGRQTVTALEIDSIWDEEEPPVQRTIGRWNGLRSACRLKLMHDSHMPTQAHGTTHSFCVGQLDPPMLEIFGTW